MSRTTEYQIAKGLSTSEIVIEVTKLITAGWEPIGGVSIGIDQARVTYCQAMVRTPPSFTPAKPAQPVARV